MHEHCVTHEVTPDLFCEPYIHTGFRPINRPYTYYMKSLFFKHNETINAWSHYIGAMYTLYLAFTMDFTDP
jgi:predicted membrane channel-forming protein YqfA (hemolysin III family)